MSAGRVAGVETTARSIAAPVTVDAAGAWVRQVAELAGAGGALAVAPVRHQLLITEPSAVDPAEPISRVADAAVYLRPARGGLMVGGFEAAPLPVDPRAEAPSFTTDDVPLELGVLGHMAAQVAGEVPLAGADRVAEHRGGLFTMSPDGRFVVGPVPGAPGLWVASGCNGLGFSSSPAIGEALAAWITLGEPPDGVAALAPGRFGALTDEQLIKNGTSGAVMGGCAAAAPHQVFRELASPPELRGARDEATVGLDERTQVLVHGALVHRAGHGVVKVVPQQRRARREQLVRLEHSRVLEVEDTGQRLNRRDRADERDRFLAARLEER